MFEYSVENQYATFRRVAARFCASANAAPGSFVKAIPPNERNQRRRRSVQIDARAKSFTLSVPYELGRELQTATASSTSRLAANLAKCFERAYMATVSEEQFNKLGLDVSCGPYDEHRRTMERSGYHILAAELESGLGEQTYHDLMRALTKDLGFDDTMQNAGTAQKHEQFSALSIAGQPLALFPS